MLDSGLYRSVLGAALGLGLAFSVPASAATYSSFATWSAANPAYSTVEFSGVAEGDVADPYTLGGITFTGSLDLAVANLGIGNALIDNAFPGSLAGAFSGMGAVGLTFGSFYGGSVQDETTELTLRLYNGNAVVHVVTQFADAFNPTFFGIDGVGPFTGFTLTFEGVDINNAPAGYDAPVLYSVNLASPVPPVPEPATLAVFGMGLLGLAAARGRRRKDSAA